MSKENTNEECVFSLYLTSFITEKDIMQDKYSSRDVESQEEERLIGRYKYLSNY